MTTFIFINHKLELLPRVAILLQKHLETVLNYSYRTKSRDDLNNPIIVARTLLLVLSTMYVVGTK